MAFSAHLKTCKVDYETRFGGDMTPEKEKYKLETKFIGPIISLKGDLTKSDQNLIFARNGTGKSFLSRGFRYLDLYGRDKDTAIKGTKEAINDLISGEAQQGSLSLYHGDVCMGKLELNKNAETAAVELSPDTIFHVFSQDFVDTELRENHYKVDNKIQTIQHEILIDRQKINTGEAEKALKTATDDKTTASKNLKETFNEKKEQCLHDKASINRQLREYKNLELDTLLNEHNEKPKITNSISDIIHDLNRLKDIPEDITKPQTVTAISTDIIDFDSLKRSLEKITSPSSVAEVVKQKIESSKQFYESGVAILDNSEHASECPFCEQNITGADPKAVIDTYLKYFNDDEAKHKEELENFDKALKNEKKKLADIQNTITQQKANYDNLKSYFSSYKDSEISTCQTEVDDVSSIINDIITIIEKKYSKLATPQTLAETNLTQSLEKMNNGIDDNNKKVQGLLKNFNDTSNERKKLQRSACDAFSLTFIEEHWSDIENLRNLDNDIKTKQKDLDELQLKALNTITQARDRVAKTFGQLLKQFFNDKYIFDKEKFSLKPKDYDINRSIDRTLSDGEKSVIGFCYFIASIHQKVTSDSDYKKLFLVVDDPVNSMSDGFVYNIAHCLKCLSFSKDGDIILNPIKNPDSNNRPKLLILTHNTYFFNLCINNRVVPKQHSCTYELSVDGNEHKLIELNKYMAPFQHQLKNIYDVSKGALPDHTTANAIRSILEAIGRFCYPDGDLDNFIKILHEEGLPIQSSLINNLSHGSYYEESPTREQLKLACDEVIQVVTKYTPGQIEPLRKINNPQS